MNKIYIISILFIYFNQNNCRHKRQIAFPAEEVEGCTTPDDRPGICEPLVRCDDLLNARDLKLLKKSICGYDNEIPKVCCPIGKQKEPQSTTRRPATSKVPKPVTKTPRPSKQNDFPNNRRPRKLPEFCGNSSVTQKTRIVGGSPSFPGSWPWMAAIFIEDSGKFSAQCGGALISEQEVITASHCVVESGSVLTPNRLRVRLGEHNIAKKTKEDAEVDYNVVKVTAHPDFEPQTYKNDIAIIKLSKRVRLNRRIWPVCLPYDTKTLTSRENVGRSGYITGWGRLQFNGKSADVLQEATIEIVSNEECGQAFDAVVKITKEYLCAGTIGSSKDSCQGDSGGPLVQVDPNNKLYYLMGIVSFGRRCATPGFPGVYARVSNFLDWISKNI